jgi:hypothetical protein
MNQNEWVWLAFRALIIGLTTLSLAPNARAQWDEQILYGFRGGSSDGAAPTGAIVFDKEGNLYGATSDGGSGTCQGFFPCGTVFRLSPPAWAGDTWSETVLWNFQGIQTGDGATPDGGLAIDSAGNLYGTTAYGGTGDCTLLGKL